MKTKTKTRPAPRRIVKKTHALNILVDAGLFAEANKVRDRTWVELAELMLRAVITGSRA